MRPIEFHGSNRTLSAPHGMEETCDPLHVYTDGEICISHWKPTLRERLALIFGRGLWLWVVSGETQPPVCVETRSPWAVPPSKTWWTPLRRSR